MNHSDLVNVAYKWVLKNCSCGVAFKELTTVAPNGERPDVIGFGAWNHSVLVEVKVSRADFLADKKKPFRIDSSKGMGTQMFYCCPDGMIDVGELPDGWGLIYVGEDFKVTFVHKPYIGNIGERNGFEKCLKSEMAIMYSALRRNFKRDI